MRFRAIAATVAWVVLSAPGAGTQAGEAPAAAGPTLREHVEFLAAGRLEGRLTGTEGEKQAAEYIAAQLRAIGLKPVPGQADLRIPFDFTAGSRDAGSSLALDAPGARRGKTWRGTDDVSALSFSDSGVVEGGVVFAGYGLRVPEGQEPSYDSYVNLDVKDKIVLVLRYSPEDTDEELRSALAQYSGLRYKAMAARDLGAKALLVVTGPRSPNAGKTIGIGFDSALSGSGIVAGSVSGKVAQKLFEHVEGKALEQVQQALDSGNPHVTGFELPDVMLRLQIEVERERRTGENVVAYLPATQAEEGARERYVMFGAHYDHLGRGGNGNSLAKKEEAGQVHRGADDNASGVAALLAAGERIARSPRRKSVLLAFWSGEELGLLGSTNFVKHGPIPLERIDAYINFDMVGRMEENRLNLQGAGSSSVWPRVIEKTNVVVGLDARTQDDPYLPTDSTPFYQAGIPTLHIFTGSHEDYHRPSDVPDLINYEGLADVVRFTHAFWKNLDRLSEPPDYVKVEPKTRAGGDRDTLRAYTGTIPDYTTEVAGLRLSGVVGGGPADKAGLREGDVIVRFGGREIANIYDYTYALDAVKIDEAVDVVVDREGERVELTIVPTTRP